MMRWNKVSLLLLSCLLLLAMTSHTVIAEEGVDSKRGKMSKVMGLDAKHLDVNQIDCFIQNEGSFGENPTTGGSGLYFPKGQTNQTIIYTAGVWVLGKVGQDVRSAVSCYGTEFQPGMILPDGTADDPTQEKYKIYKYNKGDVVDAEAIAQGCPTEVIGDQMLFSVFNDLTDHSAGMWGSPPIGIEIQETAFAFNRTGALGNTMFIRFRIINKGSATLDSAIVGIFYDPDLGQANDDFMGTDAELGIVYVFNGDNYDDVYGVEVPAMASDFFQGPIVPAPGETAELPDGTTIPDSKILPMTASFAYINGSPLPGMNDPHDPVGGYYFVSGYRGNGEPWMDPHTGAETKYPFSGDPVTGTGWLLKEISPPKDIRMGNASGPFQLEVGDVQDVVLGVVIGDGPDNLASVSIMKYYDRIAQFAYDQAFDLPSPPPQPQVTVANLDGEGVLYWDDAAAAYSEAGYEFEGYNVYQSQAEAGPWRLVATYDVVNGVTTIWDQEFNVGVGALLEQPVQFGEDTGVKYSHSITLDDIKKTPLINGKSYYFAVTAYAYNNVGTPRVLETAPIARTIVPQKPLLDVAYHAEVGQELATVKLGPANDSYIKAIVMDPTAITGDDYRVEFDYDEELGYYYNLLNTSTGETLLEKQTNLSGDDAYVTVEGVQVIVRGITPADYGLDVTKGRYGEGWDFSGTRYITGVNWGGSIFFGGGGLGEEFFGSTLGPNDYVNVEVYFWNQASHDADPVAHPWTNCQTYDRSQGYIANGIGTFPGAAYDVEDPANPRRLNICFVESDLVDHAWQPIAADAGDGYGGREYLFIMHSDYLEDPTTLYNDENDGTVADVLYAFWPTRRGSYTGNEEFVWYFWAMHPLTPGQSAFTFSTSGLEKTKTSETAAARLEEIQVFPNPYFGHNKAESNYYTQFVTVNNLPEACTIRVFSLDGTLVNTIEHTNGTPFERIYTTNHEEVPLASGMYLIHVETEFGSKILKWAFINREQAFLHF